LLLYAFAATQAQEWRVLITNRITNWSCRQHIMCGFMKCPYLELATRMWRLV
jgi:hypothetical protein